MSPQLSKPGTKGGNIKFDRLSRELGSWLKQQKDIYISTFFDYYGLREWPELDKAKTQKTLNETERILQESAITIVNSTYSKYRSEVRFIPFITLHEFEGLLFSEPKILAEHIGVKEELILGILEKCGEPEAINNHPDTAPSKRLERLSMNEQNIHYRKTTLGIQIAEAIGIDNIRKKCPIFHSWITRLEYLTPL